MANRASGRRRLRLSDVTREARDLLVAHRRTLLIGFTLVLVSRLAGFVLPASTKFLIDDILTEGRYELLVPMVLVALAATLVQAGTGFALSQVVSIAGHRTIADMRRRVHAHVLRLPASYFGNTRSGVLISRIMTDAEGVRNLIGTGIVDLMGGLLTAGIALGVLSWLNWRMTAAAVVLLLIFAGTMAFAFRRLRPIFRERGELNAQATGRLAESLGGIRTIKVYTAEKREERVFTRSVFRLFRNIGRAITGASLINAFSTVVMRGVVVLVMYMGGLAFQSGTMTLGDLVMYSVFVGLMITPLIQIAGIGTKITEAFAGLDRIRELLGTPTEAKGEGGREEVGELEGEITFDGVDFGYRPGVPVLHDISFRAPAGTTTALVGPSGSGKSTLIGLVMAFHQPDTGRISVDGRDLTGLRQAEYRREVGAVLQDNFLFDGAIRENIAFSRPGATETEIREAARIANADEFIRGFDDGYDSIVGERGIKLSGGQRQRVAIARAILADPRILILDEATSSLDSESEAMIRDGLRSLLSGRTTFVIAHRLSTIQSADQILVLDEGRLVERGGHAELRYAGGLYQRLYETQYRLEIDLFINPGEESAAGEPGIRVPTVSTAEPRAL